MKHSINLFQADLVPEQPWLTVQRILLAMLVVVLVLAAVRGVSEWQLSAARSELSQLQQQRSSAQQQISELGTQAAARRPDPRLEREIVRLEATVQTRQALLAELQRRGQLSRLDYAQLLTDLARLQRDGLWLTRIQQQQQQVTLHGKATDAGLLPEWMQSFQLAPSLADRRFTMVELKRDDADILNFVLQSSSAASQQVVIPVDDIIYESAEEQP